MNCLTRSLDLLHEKGGWFAARASVHSEWGMRAIHIDRDGRVTSYVPPEPLPSTPRQPGPPGQGGSHGTPQGVGIPSGDDRGWCEAGYAAIGHHLIEPVGFRREAGDINDEHISLKSLMTPHPQGGTFGTRIALDTTVLAQAFP